MPLRSGLPKQVRPILAMAAAQFAVLAGALRADDVAAKLPAGVKPEWDLEKAIREKTATRERVCLNGLWRWQPAQPTPKRLSHPPQAGATSRFPAAGPASATTCRKTARRSTATRAGTSAAPGRFERSVVQREVAVPEPVGRPPHRPDRRSY